MSETIEQLKWIRDRLCELRPVWTEEAAMEAGAEAYRRFPESTTVGRALLEFSLVDQSAIDRALVDALVQEATERMGPEFAAQLREWNNAGINGGSRLTSLIEDAIAKAPTPTK